MTEQLDIELEALRQQLATIEAIGAQLLAKNSELIEALDRIWHYVVTGASVTDVYVQDQPEFVRVHALLKEAGRRK